MKIFLKNYKEIEEHLSMPNAAPTYVYTEGYEAQGIVQIKSVRVNSTGLLLVKTVYGFWAIVEGNVRVITADS
jgi:hypothetical protein